MHLCLRTVAMAAVFALFPTITLIAAAERFDRDDDQRSKDPHVQLGPRPFYLVDKMAPGKLKEKLQQYAEHPFFYQTDFSIGHRGGGTLQFPEHREPRGWRPYGSGCPRV